MRDCILGATVRGTALTSGLVRFQPLPASERIELDIRLAGVIHSNTQAFKKPVRVNSTGTTNYTASKRLMISDDQFRTAGGPQVAAQTRTRVRSVTKTGGRFGKRLVEKIAWKKVHEKKPQSEWIAARHAEQRIAANFDQKVLAALSNGRVNYEGKLRAPLRRVGLLAEAIHLSSDARSIFTQVVLGSRKQITTDALPPGKLADNDVTVQLHETAVNNFLPTALAGAILRQDTPDEQPRLEGDVPSWLKKLAAKAPQELAHQGPTSPFALASTPSGKTPPAGQHPRWPRRPVPLPGSLLTRRCRFGRGISNSTPSIPPV